MTCAGAPPFVNPVPLTQSYFSSSRRLPESHTRTLLTLLSILLITLTLCSCCTPSLWLPQAPKPDPLPPSPRSSTHLGPSYSLPSPHQTRSQGEPPPPGTCFMCPLGEVARPQGPIRVHVPFSLSDLSQVEQKLGSCSSEPTCFIKESEYLPGSYDLTWRDLYIVLCTCLSPEEKEEKE